MGTLVTTHNAGFFSCCSIRLFDIIDYFNKNKNIPDVVDSSQQFLHYKQISKENLVPLFFGQNEIFIPYSGQINLTDATDELQYSDYKIINFNGLKPFIDRYFYPSITVLGFLEYFKQKYRIDCEQCCAIFYRGNDKHKETNIASHEEFINKAIELGETKKNIRFFIQSDDTDFLEQCKSKLENTFYIEEIPSIRKKYSAVHYELPSSQRAEFAAKFLAAVLIVSRCKYLITHSGNCGFWATAYRGHSFGVRQWLNDRWLSHM